MDEELRRYRWPDYKVEGRKAQDRDMNFSLEFQKHMECSFDTDIPRIEKSRNSNIRFPMQFCEKRISMVRDYLYSASGKGFKAFEVKARQQSPLVVGGLQTFDEFGIALDRNTGLPMIPASSIRGSVRLAYTLILADRNGGTVSQDEVDRIFGNTEHEGCVVFFDCFSAAYSAEKIFCKQIATPHNPGNSYLLNGKNWPIETENPVPISYLAVKSDNPWSTFFSVQSSGDEIDAQAVEDVKTAFKMAFEELGLGAHTSIGYGLFKPQIEIKELGPDSEAGSAVEDSESSAEQIVQNAPVQVEKVTREYRGAAKVDKVKPGFVVLEVEDGHRYKFSRRDGDNYVRKAIIEIAARLTEGDGDSAGIGEFIDQP